MVIEDINVTTEVEVKVNVVDILDRCSESEIKELFKEFLAEVDIIKMISEDYLLFYIRKNYSKDDVFPNETKKNEKNKNLTLATEKEVVRND